jgi:hypothetical protein
MSAKATKLRGAASFILLSFAIYVKDNDGERKAVAAVSNGTARNRKEMR